MKRPLPRQNMVVNKDTDSKVALQTEFGVEERNQRQNQTEGVEVDRPKVIPKVVLRCLVLVLFLQGANQEYYKEVKA